MRRITSLVVIAVLFALMLPLSVVARDDAPPGPTPPTPGSGYGLTGMTERVAARQGTLVSGHRPGGGYSVEVRLPDVG